MSWSVEGKTCLVTGATSGIGQETAVGLADAGAHVVICGRNPERAAQAREDVVRRSGNHRVDLLLADLSSLGGVRKLADAFLSSHPSLHVLVNNAGIVNMSRQVTEDGFEETFAVNHLAYFLLTRLLESRLREHAPARIVSVASDAHRMGSLDLSDLQSERAYAGLPIVSAFRVYGTSKLANILFTRELARRLAGSGVTANCVHPGPVATRLGQNNGGLGRILTGLLRPFFLTPAQGAETTLHVASAPGLSEVSGAYFAKKREAQPSAAARNDEAARALWEESSRLVGLEI